MLGHAVSSNRVWGPGMAVLWSCQGVVTCVTVFACFTYLTYLLTGTQKQGECWLKRGARPLPQVRGKGPGCDWTSGEAMSAVEVTLTLIPTVTLALTLTLTLTLALTLTLQARPSDFPVTPGAAMPAVS